MSESDWAAIQREFARTHGLRAARRESNVCEHCGITDGEEGEQRSGGIGRVRVRKSKQDGLTLCGNCRYLWQQDLV